MEKTLILNNYLRSRNEGLYLSLSNINYTLSSGFTAEVSSK